MIFLDVFHVSQLYEITAVGSAQDIVYVLDIVEEVEYSSESLTNIHIFIRTCVVCVFYEDCFL